MSVQRVGAKLLFAVEAGAKISTFRDWFVVAAPDLPAYLIHRTTGKREELDAAHTTAADLPDLRVDTLTLEPMT